MARGKSEFTQEHVDQMNSALGQVRPQYDIPTGPPPRTGDVNQNDINQMNQALGNRKERTE